MKARAIVALALGAVCAPQHAVWHDTHSAALARAASERKDLLIVFTGSDWCAPCIELEQRIFAMESFTIPAARDFVLTRLDYPRASAGKALVPDATANEEVARRYGVTEFPAVLLAESDGAPYARTGARAGGPQEYLTHLADLRARAAAARPRILALLAREVPAAPAPEFASLILEALTAFRALERELVIRERLLPLIRQGLAHGDDVLATDCLRLLLEARAATVAEESRALRMDARNELGLYEAVVLARLERTAFVEDMATWCTLVEGYVALDNYRDPERASRILIAAAKYYHNYLARPQGARRMAERARDLGRVPAEDEAFVRKMTGQ